MVIALFVWEGKFTSMFISDTSFVILGNIQQSR